MSGSGQALLVLMGYLALCAVAAVRHRRRSRSQPMIHADRADAVRILWASQTGSAEQLARQTALRLQGAGRPVDVAPLEQMPWTTAPQGDVLLLVSTTGEGDAPDHVQRFAQTIMASLPDLKGLRFGLLALGDATYSQFCGFGRRLEHWLRAAGAAPLFAPVELDRGDPQRLRQWWQHLEVFGAHPADAVVATDVMPWRLVDRHHLNPGSPGAPLYEVMLRPQGVMPTWNAGDLVEVCVGEDAPRTYSVASLPASGSLTLLVRQVRHADGRLGVASGWLTDQAALGELIDLRIRPNRAFQGPAQDVPMILIGNGSGLAGLMAHLQAREALGHSRNWLIYGERCARFDRPWDERLRAWLASQHLTFLDRVYSRDTPAAPYVQHRLLAQAEVLARWVAAGAVIYVCGSREGMAAGVDAAFTEILGAESVQRLRESGRYRRDVY